MRKMKRDENDTLIDRVFSPLKKLLGSVLVEQTYGICDQGNKL